MNINDFLSRFTGVVEKGDGKWMAKCPGHDDGTESLSILHNVAEGKIAINCFAGCDKKDILSNIGLSFKDLFERDQEIDPKISLQEVAKKKGVTVDFLSALGLAEISDGNAIAIPYFDIDGSNIITDGKQLTRFRVKNADTGKHEKRSRKGQTNSHPYGLEQLSNPKRKDRVWIVEGESDVWALRYVDEVALGIPGARASRVLRNYREKIGEMFSKIFIVKEADDGGKTFAREVIENLSNCPEKVHVVEWTDTTGDKDPSDTLALKGKGLICGLIEEIEKQSSETKIGEFNPTKMESVDYSFLEDTKISSNIWNLIGEQSVFDYVKNDWIFWNQKERVWVRMPFGMREIILKYLQESTKRLTGDDLKTFEKRCLTNRKIEEVEKAMRYVRRCVIYDTDLIPNDHLMTKSGLVNLKTGKVVESRKDMYITKRCPYELSKIDSPLWIQHIHKVFQGDADLIRYFQIAAGYAMTGETKERVFFILSGGGRNGKSLSLNVLRRVLGPYANVIPTAYFTNVDRNKPGADPIAMQIKGARAVFASEAEEGMKFNEGTVKSLTGSDPISARSLYKEPVTFTPNFKFFLAVNHLPSVSDTSDAFWDRVRVLPFHKRFEDHEVDRDMEFKLMQEAEGILHWLVTGAMMYYKEGLPECKSVKEVSDDYRESEDDISAFLNSRGYEKSSPTDQYLWTNLTEIHEDYRDWCDCSGLKYPRSPKSLSKSIVNKGFQKKRVSRGVIFQLWKPDSVKAGSGDSEKLPF